MPFSKMRKTVGEEGRRLVGKKKWRVLFSHVHFDMSNRHPSALGHEHCSASFFVCLPPASAPAALGHSSTSRHECKITPRVGSQHVHNGSDSAHRKDRVISLRVNLEQGGMEAKREPDR